MVRDRRVRRLPTGQYGRLDMTLLENVELAVDALSEAADAAFTAWQMVDDNPDSLSIDCKEAKIEHDKAAAAYDAAFTILLYIETKGTE